jgi:micrococcal nuclease
VALAIGLDQAGLLRSPGEGDFGRYHNQYALVIRIIDGDTLVVSLPDPLSRSKETRVRLWGIDCPEVARDEAPAERWAGEARDFAAAECGGALVRLIVEPGRVRDSFSRLLAHVELADGRSLNRELLAAGLARLDARWPHARLLTYEQAEFGARSQRRGIWSD